MCKFLWKTLAITVLTTLAYANPVWSAPEPVLAFSPEIPPQLVQLDKRNQESLLEMKRDPARAVLLSTLYPGLGQLYIGNDNPRSYWIMGGGTLILAGSLAGYGLLANRPENAASLGNLMITFTLLGYHLWNIRDAYVSADEYNKALEDRFRVGEMLAPFSLSASRLDQTPVLNYQFSL